MRLDDYFARLFPYELVALLAEPPTLYHLPPDDNRKARREFAFGFVKSVVAGGTEVSSSTTRKKKGDADLLQRHCAFGAAGGPGFATQLRERMNSHRNTTRIDLGAVYAQEPSVVKRYPTGVEFRELIFDLDIFPDYNCFRMCQCVKQQNGEPPYLCRDCWPFLAVAAHSLDYLLQKRFGFHECMWVFSGRRGLHCWVLDPEAGLLTESSRREIASFIQSIASLQSRPSQWLHVQPQFQHIYLHILKPCFDRLLERRLLNLSEKKTLGIIADTFTGVGDQNTLNIILAQLESNPERSPIAWTALLELAESSHITERLVDIVFGVMFPKIDYNVVPSPRHLLRCPMSIHSSTAGVAVPLRLDEMYELDPVALPCLHASLSIQGFGAWVGRFSNYLWSRTALADNLVCLECVLQLPSLASSLTDGMLFAQDLPRLKAHILKQHPESDGANLNPYRSTLREAIHLNTRRPDGLTDWRRKVTLYEKLETRLG